MHYFLRYVFPERRKLVEECGFYEIGDDYWAEPFIFAGPLADVDRLSESGSQFIGSWLRSHRVAGQIFVADMWGLGPDGG